MAANPLLRLLRGLWLNLLLDRTIIPTDQLQQVQADSVFQINLLLLLLELTLLLIAKSLVNLDILLLGKLVDLRFALLQLMLHVVQALEDAIQLLSQNRLFVNQLFLLLLQLRNR
jgi:hypothetical protein